MSFNRDDLKRVAWTFIQAGAAVLLAGALSWINDGVALDWEALAIAAVAAGFSAIKNLVLPDGNVVK